MDGWKTYIIDWGENVSGGRYALVQATSLAGAWFCVDEIGSPFSIAELEIPESCQEEGYRYIEICAPKKPFCGARLDQLKFKSSQETDPWSNQKSKYQQTLPSLDDVPLDKVESAELLRRLKLKLKVDSQ